jgi:hypothetical protein
MSETFLSRWSRRKRAANTSPRVGVNEKADREAGSIPPAPLGGEGGEDRRSEPGGGDYSGAELAKAPPTPNASPPRASHVGGGKNEQPPPPPAADFDPAGLPPIDSIEAGTDVSAFLRPGVPADLAQAALRRAWVADPAIRDFVGLAENAWDFNAPGGVPGFEPLRAIDDVRRLAAQVVGAIPTAAPETAAAAPEQTEPIAQAAEAAAQRPPVPPDVTAPAPAVDAATQKDASPEERQAPRPRHGGALAE